MMNTLRSVTEQLAASVDSGAIDPAVLIKLRAESKSIAKLGSSVSLSADGNMVLSGTGVTNLTSLANGSACIFVKGADGSWSQQAEFTRASDTFTRPDGTMDHPIHRLTFGSAVSLSADGSTALIGDMLDWGDGAAYIFAKGEDGTWSQQVKLDGPDSYKPMPDFFEPWQGASVYFGCSVSLSANGGIALIGAFDDDKKGSAYVFAKGENGMWNQQAKLTADDRIEHGGFGWSVSLSADGATALILGGQHLYVFAKGEDDTWSQQAKLSTVAMGEISLAADGRTALIGARYDDDKANNSGAAYVFAKTADGSWSQQAKLIAEDAAEFDNFGEAVALSADGRTALIGAYNDKNNDHGPWPGSGSAYVFVKREDGTWSQRMKLTAEDSVAGDSFGDSVALSADGQTAVIGAPGDNDNRGDGSDDPGSVYVFSIPPVNTSAPVSMMRLRR